MASYVVDRGRDPMSASMVVLEHVITRYNIVFPIK